jgi:hypothetical protein
MMHGMRTTVTLDADNAEELKAIARRRNLPFKQVLNNAVRAGLASERQGRKPFVQQTYRMGPAKVDLMKASQLADELEDEETIRKLRDPSHSSVPVENP